MRSFTLDRGLKDSSLKITLAERFSALAKFFASNKGVLPIRSVSFSAIRAISFSFYVILIYLVIFVKYLTREVGNKIQVKASRYYIMDFEGQIRYNAPIVFGMYFELRAILGQGLKRDPFCLWQKGLKRKARS